MLKDLNKLLILVGSSSMTKEERSAMISVVSNLANQYAVMASVEEDRKKCVAENREYRKILGGLELTEYRLEIRDPNKVTYTVPFVKNLREVVGSGLCEGKKMCDFRRVFLNDWQAQRLAKLMAEDKDCNYTLKAVKRVDV